MHPTPATGVGDTGAPRLRRALVSSAGGTAGRALCAQLLMRGVEVTGATGAPHAAPGVPCLPVPPPSDPAFAERLAAAARRADAEIVIPTDPRELAALVRAWPSIAGAPPALLPPAEAVAVASSPLSLARALVRARLPPPAPAGRRTSRYAACAFIGADPREDVVVVLERTALCRADMGEGPGLALADAPDVARVVRAAARAVGVRGPAELHARREGRGPVVVASVVPCFGPASLNAPEVVDAVMVSLRRAALGRVAA